MPVLAQRLRLLFLEPPGERGVDASASTGGAGVELESVVKMASVGASTAAGVAAPIEGGEGGGEGCDGALASLVVASADGGPKEVVTSAAWPSRLVASTAGLRGEAGSGVLAG